MKKVLVGLLYLIYLFLWFCIIGFALAVNKFGLFSVYSDTYGGWIIWFGVIIAVLSLVCPLYLRRLVKKEEDATSKELKTSGLSIALTVLFVVLSFGSYFITAMQYSDFTTQKWLDYPRQRVIMIDDLRNNHSIIGMDYEQVIHLLGTPDGVTDYGSLLYSYGTGEIKIDLSREKKATYIHIHEH